MSFTDNKNWTESEESFYSAYIVELDSVFAEFFNKLTSTSDTEYRTYYTSICDKMYWEFIEEQYSKFNDMVQEQLNNREIPDYNKFKVVL